MARKLSIPGYWKNNQQFVYPKGLYETQYKFAVIMAKRLGVSLIEAIKEYAPLLSKAIHIEAEGKQLLLGLTDDNLLEVGYNEVLERRKYYDSAGLTYHDEKEARFGCFYYRYNTTTKAISPHFFNAEAEEQFVDGKDVSRGPLSKVKIDRRLSELHDMFSDIKSKHPDALEVRGRSHLYNVESYRRLFPDTYVVGDIDYDQELWKRNTDIWGQFLGGNEKLPGHYGFKQVLAEDFLEKSHFIPLDKLVDAVPLPPRTAQGNIEDFYMFYNVN